MPYAIQLVDKPNSSELRATTRAAHLDYLSKNQHLLLAAGALIDDDGTGETVESSSSTPRIALWPNGSSMRIPSPKPDSFKE